MCWGQKVLPSFNIQGSAAAENYFELLKLNYRVYEPIL